MEGACISTSFFAKLKHLGSLLNPLNWSKRTIKVVTTFIFAICMPLYIFFGFQPVSTADAIHYPTLEIPSIQLQSPVASLELNRHQLVAPATIAGAYSRYENKTLIIGHSTTVFQRLSDVKSQELIYYDQQAYQINHIYVQEKSTISMADILAPASTPTLIIMTCAGTPLPNQDATHRLIVEATLVNLD